MTMALLSANLLLFLLATVATGAPHMRTAFVDGSVARLSVSVITASREMAVPKRRAATSATS